MNQNYGSVMRINDQDWEGTRIDFMTTRINECFLGHETGSHEDDITLPRSAVLVQTNMKPAKDLERVFYIIRLIAKHS